MICIFAAFAILCLDCLVWITKAPSLAWLLNLYVPTDKSINKIDSCTNKYVNFWVMLKNKPLISPSEILANKWMNWCRKCPVPIHEKMTCFSSYIKSPFSHKLQTRAFLSGILPYKPVSHFNPCPRILNQATFLMTFWLILILSTLARQMVHVHQDSPVSQAKQTNCDKPQTF